MQKMQKSALLQAKMQKTKSKNAEKCIQASTVVIAGDSRLAKMQKMQKSAPLQAKMQKMISRNAEK